MEDNIKELIRLQELEIQDLDHNINRLKQQLEDCKKTKLAIVNTLVKLKKVE